MKKRLISLLLILGTLLTLFPVMGVAAEEVLPKDETLPAGEGESAEGATLNEYDLLYVGADGSKTAAGGELIAYYSALREDVATVNLTAKTWRDKLGKSPDATIIGSDWSLLSDGGFGYDFPYSSFTKVSGSYGLALSDDFLDLQSLYIETLGKVNSFRNEDGTLIDVSPSNVLRYNNDAKNYTSFARIDVLCSLFFIGIPRSTT
ncbi:MAG: hypothetical protein J6S44_02195, partial [Clostridia bacterium]|nr:hypothetical protein [Clostridia bacterium]